MLERFLVVQRDPQIMSIIHQVVLSFSRHFFFSQVFTTPHCWGGGQENINGKTNRAGLTESVIQGKTSPDPVSACSPWRWAVPALQRSYSGQVAATTSPAPPRTAALLMFRSHSFADTRRPAGTHTVCLPDFSCGECGSWLGTASWSGLPPPLHAWREGVIGGVRGVPPVSIGTEAHRGSLKEGLKLWYRPPPPLSIPSYPPSSTHTNTQTNGNNLNVTHAN